MELYTIFYDYYDKRGHRRNKKIMCCGNERLQQKCIEISKLIDHKPISEPLIYITQGVSDYVGTIDYNKVLKGEM